MVEYVPNNCFIKRLRAAVIVLVGPCGPALLSCIGVDVRTVVQMIQHWQWVCCVLCVGVKGGAGSSSWLRELGSVSGLSSLNACPPWLAPYHPVYHNAAAAAAAAAMAAAQLVCSFPPLSIALCPCLSVCLSVNKLAHTRSPSVGFRSRSQFLAVSLQVTWVTNPAVGCHYFSPGLQLPSQPLRGLLPILLLVEQRHDGCEQFA